MGSSFKSSSEAFAFKSRRDIEKAYDAERSAMISAIHRDTPYEKGADAFNAALQKMDDTLDAKYKPIYKQELAARKEAKAKEAQEKAEAKEDEVKRVAGIASGIVRGLAPQRQALTDRLLEYRRSSYDTMRANLEKNGGKLSNFFKGVDRYEKEREWIKANKDNLETHKLDSDGKRIPEGEYGIARSYSYSLKAEPDTSTWHSEAARNAASIVDSFASKIVMKTEEHAKANDSKDEKIIGTPTVKSHLDPWQDSQITIETTHRTITWSTNMILNRSVNDNYFNQWPTRLVSDKKK